jgi:hypothetical protein
MPFVGVEQKVLKETYHCYICKMPFSVHSTLEKHMRKCVVNNNQLLRNGGGVAHASNADSQQSSPTDKGEGKQ